MEAVKPSIGGQAVIEGVMMRSPRLTGIAVRQPDGEIVVKKEKNHSLSDKYKFLKFPLLRGVLSLIEMLILGMSSLSYSASMAGEDEEELTKKDMFIALVSALGFSILLFIVIPTTVVRIIAKSIESPLILNLIEGIIRISIFVIYIAVISNMKDIRRVFEYHGAEHKVVHCYEHNDKLTPENAKKYSTIHPRCGTSFMMIVMIVSILLFSFLGWPGIVQRIISRILLLPLVSGISYEIIRIAGKSGNSFVRALNIPGMWLQKLTTREPDEAQLEVAIEAMKSVF